MAIEKVEGKKFEWTPAVLSQLGAAALLFILSLVFGWLALARWQFKRNVVEGYRLHDSRNVGAAKGPLKSAQGWNAENPGPSQVLAKIACEAGDTGAAEALYQGLLSRGYSRPQVRVGMGVVNLKKAVAATDKAEINRFVGAAMQEFKAAGAETPEAEIGLGHCELVLAHKLGETTRYATARQVFGKVKAALDSREAYRRGITREGLLDFYCGLGKASGSGGTYDPGTRQAYQVCAQYEASWEIPQKSMVAAEAIRFARASGDLAGTVEDARKFLLEFNNKWKPNAAMWANFKEQWMALALSASLAFARAGMEKECTEFLEQVTRGGGYGDRVEPYQVEAAGRAILFLRENPNLSANDRTKYVGTAFSKCEALIPRLRPENDPKNDWKARAANMMGVLEAWRAANQKQVAIWGRALARFDEALKAAPDDYVYNRNAALAAKRLKRPAAAIQAYVDKAKAAASGDYAKDFEELQKVLAGN
jgi:hypothetical protein